MANYLYNGVELPALPDWDKETYPYAYIGTNIVTGGTELAFFSARMAATRSDGVFSMFIRDTMGGLYRLVDGVWKSGTGGAYSFLPFWCNADYYYSKSSQYSIEESLLGTLYLAASDPIPVGVNPPDPLSLVMGYRVGCAIRANRSKQKTITGYSYNGTVLPALPDWDREMYPYAFLTYAESIETADLYVSTVPFVGYSYENPDYYNGISVYAPTGAEYYHYVKDQSKQDWVMFPDFALDIIKDKALSFGEEKLPAVWSNHDIINTEDDSVYLAASDPIPVYA